MSPPAVARRASLRRRVVAFAAAIALLGGLWLAREVRVVLNPPPRLVFPPAARADVALVPSGDPGLRTRGAVALLAAGRVERLVFSGAGHGGDSAAQHAAYARRLGAPADRIWVEPTARNTYANVVESLALLEARGARPERLVVVTSASHAARAGLVAERQAPGIRVWVHPVEDGATWDMLVREAAALTVYRLRGRIAGW